MLNYSKLKSMMARKMKPKSLDEYDEETTKGKMPKAFSIYRKGDRDISNESGHGRYKHQGLTEYIEAMTKAEKEGKYRMDARKPRSA